MPKGFATVLLIGFLVVLTSPLEAAWQAPLISSVPQTTLTARAQPYTMQVKGKNFHQGMLVSSGVIVAGSIGGNQFTWTVTVPNTGYVVLQVTNTDGKSSNAVTITVLAATPQSPQPIPLTIACPDSQTLTAMVIPWPVSYPNAKISGGAQPVVVNYSIPSGASFPPGPTTVLATALAADGLSRSCSFSITINYVPTPSPVSSDGTLMPPAPSITVEDLSIWTLHPSTSWPAPIMETWRNGAQFAGGLGDLVKKCLSTAFTRGTDGVWYRPDIARVGWDRLDLNDPCVVVPPPIICTDPSATNMGGPLPCTYPPPVPVYPVGFRIYDGATVIAFITGSWVRSYALPTLVIGTHTFTMTSVSLDSGGNPLPNTESAHAATIPASTSITDTMPKTLMWDWMP